MKSLDIYSDTSYLGFQHVNQMLFNYLKENKKEEEYYFYHRFYMRFPAGYSLLKRFCSRRGSKFEVDEPLFSDSIKKIINFPSENSMLDIINSKIVKYQINKNSDIALTFVPSKALSRLFEQYENVIYYCVHDSNMQEYSNRHRKYESELVEASKVVFCDNKIVLSRLAGGTAIHDISTLTYSQLEEVKNSSEKYFYVPPPTPNEFFDLPNTDVIFDFIYFGSLHKDIDEDCLYRLASSERKVAIISNSRLSFSSKNIVYLKPTSNFTSLVRMISSSRSIILPYKNSEFMDTVSPAKIFQCIATSLPIYCSNDEICSKYPVNRFDDIFDSDYTIKIADKDVALPTKADAIFDKLSTLIQL